MAKEKRFEIIICFPAGVTGPRYAVNDTVNGTRLATFFDDSIEYSNIVVWVDLLNKMKDERCIHAAAEVLKNMRETKPSLSKELKKILTAKQMELAFTTKTIPGSTNRYMCIGQTGVTRCMVNQEKTPMRSPDQGLAQQYGATGEMTLDESLRISELEF